MKIPNIGDRLWTMVSNIPRERIVKYVSTSDQWVRFTNDRMKMISDCYTSLDELMDDLRRKAEIKEEPNEQKRYRLKADVDRRF